MADCVECGIHAVTTVPDPRCQTHAAEYYQGLVRVASAMLQAGMYTTPIQTKFTDAELAGWHRTCRRCPASFTTSRYHATLCPACMRAAKSAARLLVMEKRRQQLETGVTKCA